MTGEGTKYLTAFLGSLFRLPVTRLIYFKKAKTLHHRTGLSYIMTKNTKIKIRTLTTYYWDLWQATPFMTTRQTTTYAANYILQAY